VIVLLIILIIIKIIIKTKVTVTAVRVCGGGRGGKVNYFYILLV